MAVYYNEIDAAAVAVLRQLIADGVIAAGDVDTRSIKEVQPDDLRGYTQCHFFAGGGLWSVAARLVGWPDDRALWSGSCPCQPFSAAGKGLGTDDPRHLWPDFHRLIRACRPTVVVGEQVASAPGYRWFDGVGADLEGEGYSCRAVDFPACAVDAPHQRNRLYWAAVGLADSHSARSLSTSHAGIHRQAQGEWPWDGESERRDGNDRGVDLADAEGQRSRRDEPQRRPEGRATAWWADEGSSVVQDDAMLQRERHPGEPILAGRDGADHANGRSVDQVDATRIGWREGRTELAGRELVAPSAVANLRSVTLGDAIGEGLEGFAGDGDGSWRPEPDRPVAEADVAGAASSVAQGHAKSGSGESAWQPEAHHRQAREWEPRGPDSSTVGQADCDEPFLQRQPSARQLAFDEQDARTRGRNGTYWSDAEWLICHDNKARRAKPGLRLLVDGLPGRVDLWRVGGNAIVPQAAAEVIGALMDVLDGVAA